MKTKIIDIMVNAVEAMIASINKNTAPINEGKKPVICNAKVNKVT